MCSALGDRERPTSHRKRTAADHFRERFGVRFFAIPLVVRVSEIHASRLLNRRVLHVHGQPIGRIEELHVEIDATDSNEYVVREFHVGAYALLEAMARDAFVRALAPLLARRGYKRYVIPWDILDLSDPERPRSRLSREELETRQ